MRTLQGIIVSNRMAKTAVVRVDHLRKHAKYGKFYRKSRKYKVHAENPDSFKIGDTVRIQETRPMSKEKRWRAIEVIKRMPAGEAVGDVSQRTAIF